MLAKGDLVHFLLDKVTQDGNRFTIFTVQSELAATGVLVQGYQRAAIRLSHDVKLFFDDVDACSPDRVRVPKVDNVNYELRWDLLEQIVAMMVLINVTLDISGLLQEQVKVCWCCLCPVHLSLADELTSRDHLADL